MPDLLGLLSYGTFFLVFVMIYGLVVLGLNLQWGFTGLFNVGVAGFVAIGAYTSALLTAPDYPDQIGGLGLPIPLGWLGAMATSGLAAFIVGVAALRLRHDYLAITTFGIAVTLQLVALNAQGLTGGTFGLQFIPKPFADVIADKLAWNLSYLAMAGTLLGLSYVALERLVRSPWGRVLRAIREDETAAESLGKRAFLGAVVVWALWTLSGNVLRELVPAEHQARAATLQVVLIGLLLMLILLVRPRGLLGEEAVVSRHMKDSAGDVQKE